MEEKALLNTLRYLNFKCDKASKIRVRSECSRIFRLAETNCVDFKKGLQKVVYSKKGKKRYVAKYTSAFDEGYSIERNLAHQISKACKINFPNRALMIHELFGIIEVLKFMMDYTIIRFDFRGYFYSIKPVYVWETLLKDTLPEYVDIDLIEKYCKSMDIAYPGLEMSNVIAELIGLEFDRRLKSYVQDYGILFYGRFVDDGVFILKKGVDEISLKKVMNKALKETYQKCGFSAKCKTKFHPSNSQKFLIKTMRDIYNSPLDFSFLGYHFHVEYNTENGNMLSSYGIVQEKIDKYMSRLTNALKTCANGEQCMLMLRIQLSRVVYSIKEDGVDYWKERGFASIYKELREVKDDSNIILSTKSSLESLAYNALVNSGNARLLSNAQMNAVQNGKKYNLYSSIRSRNTLIFDYHTRIGYDWKTLLKHVKTMRGSCKNVDYQSLTKELLIKTKIGY